jgi:hypothetical protein
MVYDMLIAKKRYYIGSNTIQEQVLAIKVPIKCTHLECRYNKLYIRKVCIHTTANTCKLSNLRFMELTSISIVGI